MANLAVIEKIEAVALNPKTRFMVALAQSMPQGAGLLPAALVRGALSAIKNSDQLQRCSEQSLFFSIAEVAQTGLSLDVHLGQAYLVPFSGVATVMYGYRGLCELARRSGQVTEIVGELRYAKDEWSLRLGSNRELIHVPADLPDSKRGELLGAYAIAELLQGRPVFEYMTAEQILKIKNGVIRRKKSDKPSVWETDNELEMWRKTPIRRLAKRLPQSPSLIPFVQAAIRDEYRQAGNIQRAPVTPLVEEALEAAGVDTSTAGAEQRPRESAIKETKKGAAPDACLSKNQIRDAQILLGDLKLESTDMGKALKALGHQGKLADLPGSKFPQLLDALQKLGQ